MCSSDLKLWPGASGALQEHWQFASADHSMDGQLPKAVVTLDWCRTSGCWARNVASRGVRRQIALIRQERVIEAEHLRKRGPFWLPYGKKKSRSPPEE